MNVLRTTSVMIKSNSFRFVYSIGVIALITSVGAKANAFQSSDLLIAQRLAQPPFTKAVSQEEPDASDASKNQPTNSTSRSTDERPKQSSPKTQKDETVSVDDVPSECRSYFPSKGSVNLFDYQEGVERCRYGAE